MRAVTDAIRGAIRVRETKCSLDEVESLKKFSVSKFVQLAFSTGRLNEKDFISVESPEEVRFYGKSDFKKTDGVEVVKNRKYVKIV
jgi:hypothetical protein